MLRILIVDDREDTRSTLKEWIEENLPSGVNMAVDDIFPLEDISGYASYIREKDVAALLLDERLNEEQNPSTGLKTPYMGHDVVGHLRRALPDFPVYVVTTWSGDADLLEKEAEFEDVVDRDDFVRHPEKYTARIQRSAMRFQAMMQQHLSNLGELTLKAAQGALVPEEMAQLVSTRELLGLPFSGDSDMVASDLIAEARSLVEKSESLINKIKSRSQME